MNAREKLRKRSGKEFDTIRARSRLSRVRPEFFAWPELISSWSRLKARMPLVWPEQHRGGDKKVEGSHDPGGQRSQVLR